jgi:hypothetical protein
MGSSCMRRGDVDCDVILANDELERVDFDDLYA